MHSQYEHNGLTWVDLESPTREEVQDTMEEFGLDGSVAEELMLPTAKPRTDFYPSYAYVVMHFPALRHSHKTLEQEVDFIVGKNFVITAHYDTVDTLHKFSKVFEVNAILDKSAIGDHAGFLFFYLLKNLYKAVDYEIECVRRDLGTIEERIFKGDEVEMVNAISRCARDLLNLRQTIEPHREVLQTLESEGVQFFGQEFRSYLRSLSNEYYRVHNHIMRHTEALHELRESNNSLLTTKQNETMRVLTIMALLTFPLALFVAIFDIDATSNPIIGLPYDFWIIVGIVFLAGGMMLTYFRYKKWI